MDRKAAFTPFFTTSMTLAPRTPLHAALRTLRSTQGPWLAGILLLAGILTSPGAQALTYCCTTAQGRTACGDILPQECHGRAHRVLNERGTIIRRIAAPLTEEQLAERKAEEQRKKQAAAQALATQRQNQALLSTYASVEEIDLVRDRALDQISASVKTLQTKYDETLKRRAQLNDELAQYDAAAESVPKALRERIRTNELDLQTQLSATEQKKEEMQQVIKRYADEKRRYIELQQNTSAQPARAH